MRITVLGKSPSCQDAAGACSGYLVREGDFTLPARLRQRRLLKAPPDLPGSQRPVRPELYVPVGGAAVLRKIVGCWGNDDLIEKAFGDAQVRGAGRARSGPAGDPLLRGSALFGYPRG